MTPSIQDGIDFETERRYRKEGARFIMQIGTGMGLGHNTLATGIVYFHRFYMFHSFKTFPRYVTASCCLFLAGKVEETPKKCKDIIKKAQSLLSGQKFLSFGEDPKEEVMTLERILLQTIKFDLQVEHPYSFLVKYAKCLKGDNAKLQKMVQMAWNFVNDSLSTTVCLQWEPEIIAVALIHLASKLSKFSVVDWVGRQQQHLRWWDMFVADVTMEILEDICHQVLDLYQSNQNEPVPESPPQLPPSKASPPMKRANTSPIQEKTTPPTAPPLNSRTTTTATVVASEDKVDTGNPIPKIVTDNVVHPPAYSYPPAFNTMSFPPPHQQQHPPPGYPPAMPPSQPIYSQQYAPVPQSHYPPPPMSHHHHAPHSSSIPPNYYGMQPASSRSYYHPPP